MIEANAAAALVSAGGRVHEKDGVWWRHVSLGFCKPVDPMRTIEVGSSRPKVTASIVGFSHRVACADQANHAWNIMMLDSGALDQFEISRLKPRKRTTVRKSLRQLKVEGIADIDSYLDAMNDICISVAERTGHGLPPSHYRENRSKWENFMRREFQIPGREWWGVFDGDSMIAYYYAFLIGGTMHISAAKSHSDGLRLKPNDAFLFTFLEHCRELEDCQAVVFGDWSPDASTLNSFKESYGFAATAIPIYRHIRPLVRGIAKIRLAVKGSSG